SAGRETAANGGKRPVIAAEKDELALESGFRQRFPKSLEAAVGAAVDHEDRLEILFDTGVEGGERAEQVRDVFLALIDRNYERNHRRLSKPLTAAMTSALSAEVKKGWMGRESSRFARSWAWVKGKGTKWGASFMIACCGMRIG